MNFENAFLIGIPGAAIALVFALVQARKVLAFPEGNEKMRRLA